MSPTDIPMFDEHTHALVGDTPVEAFAAAIEIEPPPQTFDEALMLGQGKPRKLTDHPLLVRNGGPSRPAN